MAVVLTGIYGVYLVTPPIAVVVVSRWASGLPLLWPRWRCIPWLEWLANVALWSPVSHLVAFGTMGITCREVCSASWLLLCAVGTVMEGADGVWPLLWWLVWATCLVSWQMASTGLELWETCSRACWMVKWFTAISASSLEGVLNGLAISFPRSFPSLWYAWMMRQCSLCLWCSSLMILQWSNSVLMHVTRSWGSSPSLATICLSSPRHTWVLTLCVIPCWIWLRKAEAFTLVTFYSSSLPIGIHCACISRDLVPRAAKTYLRWSLLSSGMWLRRSQFSREWQNMEKDW